MKDLTGKRFGRQIALRPCGKNKYGNVLWLCKCDCGREILAEPYKIRNKVISSCGCIRTEKKIKDITGGDSLAANIQLVYNNAKLAADTACELAKLRKAD